MLNVFIWVLLLIYFWYFYYSDSKPIRRPSSVAGPDPISPFHLTYRKVNEHAFEFRVNGHSVWQQEIPSYLVTADQIREIDDCFYSRDAKIPAEKLGLYTFVQENPKFQSLIGQSVHDNGTIFRHGTPFYFTCKGKKIETLTLCPPGRIFQNGACKKLSSCTGHPDRTRFPHPDPHSWIECQDEEERVRQCAPGEVFYGGKCTSKTESLCLLQRNLGFFKLDDTTLFGCRNHAPLYKKCPVGTQLFDSSTTCEPSDCVGKPDQTRIPLRKRKRKYPFEYSPGYTVCRRGRVADTVECPSVWDPSLAKEENLTSLPMVFHRDTCAVPSLCENVWPTEDEVYVPRYEYTRDIQNWFYSKFYDQGKGFFCDAAGVKTEYNTPFDKRINDHFKQVPACNDHDPSFLPLSDRLRNYLDCTRQSFETCAPDQFFNGSQCVPLPEGPVFKYHNFMPLFQFDALNPDGWIAPLPKIAGQDQLCDPGFEYVKMYQLCSDPLCVPFAFLSMIPELSLFLKTTRAKCTYDETKKVLERIPISDTLNYTFWDQKVRREPDIPAETCRFGETLQTGHFIWDKTVYATCDDTQPFVFCPSPHTKQIFPGHYACAPPVSTTWLHDQLLDQHTEYRVNEFKRVLRVDKTTSVHIQLNKSARYNHWQEVPEEGFEIPNKERVNIKATSPVLLEYKWRVTYPPHVAFEYVTDQQGTTRRVTHVADDPTKIFNLYTEQFEHGKFQFPRYRVKSFVDRWTIERDP